MSGERGAASPVLLAVAVLLMVLGAALGGAGQALAARGRAAAAADAAALAAAPVTFASFGAAGGPAAEASRFATANGARLVRCECTVDRSWRTRVVEVEVEVKVRVLLLGQRRVRAVSRAEFAPVALLSS